MLYDEITASSLVKIDSDGNNVEPTDAPVNRGGFAIPSTIHRARPEIACVIHTHTIAGCAVSMQKQGLLPMNQHALQVLGDVAYHDYEGSGRSGEERRRFLADLGDRHIMVLRNHGLIVIGETIGCETCAMSPSGFRTATDQFEGPRIMTPSRTACPPIAAAMF